MGLDLKNHITLHMTLHQPHDFTPKKQHDFTPKKPHDFTHGFISFPRRDKINKFSYGKQ